MKVIAGCIKFRFIANPNLNDPCSHVMLSATLSKYHKKHIPGQSVVVIGCYVSLPNSLVIFIIIFLKCLIYFDSHEKKTNVTILKHII